MSPEGSRLYVSETTGNTVAAHARVLDLGRHFGDATRATRSAT